MVLARVLQHVQISATFILHESAMAMAKMDLTNVKRRHFNVQGVVQGVGFRPFVHGLVDKLNLTGWVRNTTCGVEMELQGKDEDLEQFQDGLTREAPPLARVMDVHIRSMAPLMQAEPGMRIVESRCADGRTLISPDVATCEVCQAELCNINDRRYGYPFINCTHCGPRFTIIRDLPYDRPYTTMAEFALCAACAAEYADPNDRRFHAQPVACSNCGPVVWYTETGDVEPPVEVDDSALVGAIHRLKRGGIIGIRGLGGFHLCCRADHDAAVMRLRTSKFRPSKPLAVMVQNVDEARQFCVLDDIEAELLQAPEAPIVLLKKAKQALASQIAPQNAYLGIMLPYTPLHHLLIAGVESPLVMTSGNPSGEPLCKDNDEAVDRLGKFVDGFLLHNRSIERRCDDSVMMVAKFAEDAGVQTVRRSRGLVPLPVFLPRGLALNCDVLAAGSDMKNVAAVASGRQVFHTAHIGEMGDPKVLAEHKQALKDLERLFRIHPKAIVCDLHPDYVSTRFAQAESKKRKLPLIYVQHHHAHIAGCMAENGVTDPVIGLSFDGTGYGDDGCIWGGEVLLADLANYERFAHLEYLPLPGGDAAVQKPYRVALAYLHALLPNVSVLDFFQRVPDSERELIERMVDGKINSPLTSSVGRLFDAVSALLGLCHVATHEAQAAMVLEAEALTCNHDAGHYRFEVVAQGIRVKPMFAEMIFDLKRGIRRAVIARKFHQTVAQMAVACARAVREHSGIERVALSGGVWQNRLLLEVAVGLLRESGFDVLLHHSVPANDGGLAYGQVAVAAAQMKAGSCDVFGCAWKG